MKLTPLALAGSLLANAALVGAFALRPTLAPLAYRIFFVRTFGASAEPTTTARPAPAPRAAVEKQKLWAQLATDDLPSLIARLRAAGFPPGVIRGIITAQLNRRFNARIAPLVATDPNTPFWKTAPNFYGSDPKRYEEVTAIERERAKALRAMFADDFFATGEVPAEQRRKFGNLPRNKIDAAQRIEDDYADMYAQIRAAMGGVTLPVDREKFALLAREKQVDLAAVLSPAELADYTLRSSAITNQLRNQLGLFDATEAEFRAIFQVQQTLNEKFPPNQSGGTISMPGDYESRRALQQELETQLKASMGEARYTEYLRDTNRDFQQLTRLAERDHLPADAAVRAFSFRDTVAQESSRIFDDASLDADAKRAALATLAQNTRTQILAALGPISGPAYVKIADVWLTNVERGAAVSFNVANTTSMISMDNAGTVTMISMSGLTPAYKRLPGATPAPQTGTLILNPGR